MNMKRKILLFALAALLAAAAAFGLSACGNLGSPPVENAEFEEYEKIVSTVIEKSMDELGGNAQRGKSAKAAARAARPLSFGADEKEELFAYLKAVQDKEPADNSGFFDDVFEQSFYIPLIGGHAIREYHRAEQFYGVNIALPFYGQYLCTKSQGTRKTTYVYCDQTADEDRSYMEFVVCDIDYKSENDYSFYAVQFSADFSDLLFLYGNSDMEFLAYSSSSASGTYVLYNADGAGYAVKDHTAAEKCRDATIDVFQSFDQNYIKSIGSEPQYTLTSDEWADSNDHYLGEDSTEGSVEPGHFDIQNGMLYGWAGNSEECPERVVLPAEADCIYYELQFPEHVKELVIPASVQTIKIEQSLLDSMEGKENGGESETLVECPAKYFSVRLLTEDGSERFLQKIGAEAGSPLFSSEDDCLYAKDGTLVYIGSGSNIERLALENVSETAMRCLENINFPALKSIAARGAGLYALTRMTDGAGEPFALQELDIEWSNTEEFYPAVGHRLTAAESIRLQADCREYTGYPSAATFACSAKTFRLTGQGECEIYFQTDEGEISVGNTAIDFAGTVHLDIYGKADTVELSDKVTGYWSTVFSDAETLMPVSLFDFWLNKKYEEFLDVGNILSEMELFDCDKTELTAEHIHEGENGEEIFINTYVFKAMSAEERADYETLCDFRNYRFNEDGTANLTGYWGEGPAIRVPETLLGRRVTSFYLTTDAFSSEFDPPTVAAIKELYLPAQVALDVWNPEYDEVRFRLDKIVYAGTKAQFIRLFNNEGQVYALFDLTEQILCADGAFLPGEQEMRIRYEMQADPLATLSISVDWSARSMAFELEIENELYKGHIIDDFNGNYYWDFGEVPFEDDKDGIGYEYQYSLCVWSHTTYYGDGFAFYYVTASLETRPIEGMQEETYEFVQLNSARLDDDFLFEHDPEDEPFFTQPPTCDSGGYSEYRCKLCDQIFYTKEEEGLGHLWSDWYTVEADCSEPQHERRDCLREGCGYYETDGYVGLPLDHIFGSPYYVEATCTETAHREQKCTREGCGYIYKYDYTGEPLGHTWETVILQEPADCSEIGIREKKCSVCGFSEGTEDFFIPHTYNEEGFCTGCKKLHLYYEIWYEQSEDGTTGAYICTRHDFEGEYPEEIIIPGEVFGYKVISADFDGAWYLNKVIFEDGYAGTFRFADSSATEIVLPSALPQIPGDTFRNCLSLQTIRYSGTVEQWLNLDKGYDWAYNVNCTVYCSDGSVSVVNGEESFSEI